jgi:hypothetical protein
MAIARRNLMVYSTEKRGKSVRTGTGLSFFNTAAPSLDASEVPKATGFFIRATHYFPEYVVEWDTHETATDQAHAGSLRVARFFVLGSAALIFGPGFFGEFDDLGNAAVDVFLPEVFVLGLENLIAFFESLAGAGLDYGVFFYVVDPSVDVFHGPTSVGRRLATIDALASLGYEVRALHFVGQFRSPKVPWADSRN